MKKVVITQSNYIPWKGYFDSIDKVDTVILYDDMQYTKRDWRNRNKIKTESGLKWLSVPVQVKGKYFQKINETLVSESDWNEKHFNQIRQSYRKAPCYKSQIDWVENLYANCKHQNLSHINQYFIEKINAFLGINTKILRSEEFNLVEGKTEKLVSICKELKATDYYSGPAAKNYMKEDLFSKENISIHYFNYNNYPEYPQIHGDFEHGVSILDLIFNLGEQTKDYYRNGK